VDKRNLEMMYVICFYWQGDRWQTSNYVPPKGHVNRQQNAMTRLGVIDKHLPSRYVNNLYYGISEHTDGDFKFVCFTNEKLDGLDQGIEVRNLPMFTVEGVLPRMYMFSEEAGLQGHQVLCLDLDVVIVGSLKNVLDYNGVFCARSRFRPGEETLLDGDIMSFQANKITQRMFWDPFIEDLEYAIELTQGRERYWVRHVAGDIADRWDKVAPGNIVSYRWHVQRWNQIPAGAAIVSCHGKPRPHQINQTWIKPYWRW
jgi:hypothetical protein